MNDNNDGVIELSEDGVFEIPSPSNAVKRLSKGQKEEQEEEVYPIPSSSSSSSVDGSAVNLDDIAEEEYKVFQDEGGKKLNIVINVAKDHGDAQSVEFSRKDKVLTVITSSGLKIPIDLSNITSSEPDAAGCTARRHDSFLLVVVPYK